MGIVIEFNESAFRHGISKEDIRCALVNWKYDDIDEDDPNKNLLIGGGVSESMILLKCIRN